MKYVIGLDKAGHILPFVFDAHIRHKDVVKIALADAEILSAGVCSITNGMVRCCGESRSLGKKSDEQDALKLQNFLLGK